jgi:hypothetical protein
MEGAEGLEQLERFEPNIQVISFVNSRVRKNLAERFQPFQPFQLVMNSVGYEGAAVKRLEQLRPESSA